MGEELESLGLLQGLLPSDGEIIDPIDQPVISQSLIIDLCLQLIKTVDLDPKKNYIFGFHPHGETHTHT